jgi:GT2 family glycosyltransferase
MNRPDELKRCLESVFQSLEGPDEVIVSDDSTDPQPVQEVIHNFPSIIYKQGPRLGLGANRNTCIRCIKQGSYVIFIDDDVRVPEEFFTVARQLITSSDTKIIITGFEMNYGGGGRWEGEVRKVVPHNIDFWGFQHLPVLNQLRAIVINATIFPPTLFERALFDKNLRYGCEEIDMAMNAVALGYTIYYADSLYVYHYPSLTNRDSYKPFIDASRLYATTKAYWHYEKSIFKAMAFLLLAPLQLAGSAARRGNIPGMLKAFQSTALAYSYLYNSSKINSL